MPYDKNKEDRRGDDSREAVAAKVAWSAVKKEYEKVDEKWQKKDD
jgi:cation transport regulator